MKFVIDSNFLSQSAIDNLYNLYYDYWDLITKFWPRSLKCNTPLKGFTKGVDTPPRHEKSQMRQLILDTHRHNKKDSTLEEQ